MINGSLLIKTLLSSNWTASNTSNRTPSFSEYYEKRRVNGFDNTDDVLVYNRVENENPSSVGNLTRQVINRVVVDIRTDVSDLHVNKMLREVKRLIHTNVNYIVPGSMSDHSTTGQQVIMEVISTTPFSNSENNNTFKNFRRVIELQLTSAAEGV